MYFSSDFLNFQKNRYHEVVKVDRKSRRMQCIGALNRRVTGSRGISHEYTFHPIFLIFKRTDITKS